MVITFSNHYFEARDFFNNNTFVTHLKEASKARQVNENIILSIMIKIKQNNLCLNTNLDNNNLDNNKFIDFDIDVFIAIAQKLHQPGMLYSNIRSEKYRTSVQLWNMYIKKEEDNQLVVDLLITKFTC